MERSRQAGFSASRTAAATDHAPGDRNTLQPIRPYYVTSTTYYVPQIEEVLLRDFTRGKRDHQRISNAIFTSDLMKSREAFILLCIGEGEEWRLLPYRCSLPENTTIDAAAECYTRVHDEKPYETDPYDPSSRCLLWDHSLFSKGKSLDPRRYTLLITVWLRINCACRLTGTSTVFYTRNPYTKEKLRRYCDNHLAAVKYLDSFEDPSDDVVDKQVLIDLLKPLGNSYYSEDRGLIRVEEQVTLQQLPTPLQVLTTTFPDVEWNPDGGVQNRFARYLEAQVPFHYDPLRESVIGDVVRYKLYIGCVLVLEDIAQKQQEEDVEAGVLDALHYYYVAFLDLFWFCINHAEYHSMSNACLLKPMQYYNAMTAWELFNPYRSDTRAFHAGDLPDFFGVVTDIPLHGDQHKSSFTIGKVIQKCLPFCGQRRKLIEVVCAHNSRDPAFWQVFCKIFWCMLAGMYPGDKERPKMKALLRIRQLTDALTAKNILNDALAKGEYDGSALVVFTAFRRYVLYLAQENVHYVEEADKCIDWGVLQTDTIIRAELIRGSNLFPDDPFARARVLLTKMHKNNSELEVYRYRKSSCIKTLGKCVCVCVSTLNPRGALRARLVF